LPENCPPHRERISRTDALATPPKGTRLEPLHRSKPRFPAGRGALNLNRTLTENALLQRNNTGLSGPVAIPVRRCNDRGKTMLHQCAFRCVFQD